MESTRGKTPSVFGGAGFLSINRMTHYLPFFWGNEDIFCWTEVWVRVHHMDDVDAKLLPKAKGLCLWFQWSSIQCRGTKRIGVWIGLLRASKKVCKLGFVHWKKTKTQPQTIKIIMFFFKGGRNTINNPSIHHSYRSVRWVWHQFFNGKKIPVNNDCNLTRNHWLFWSELWVGMIRFYVQGVLNNLANFAGFDPINCPFILIEFFSFNQCVSFTSVILSLYTGTHICTSAPPRCLKMQCLQGWF